MKYPQRLATRLTVSFVALFLVTYSVVALVSLYFANTTVTRSNDDNLRGLAQTVEERLNNGDDPKRVVDDLSSATQFIQVVDVRGRVDVLSANLTHGPLPSHLPSRRITRYGFHTDRYTNASVRLVRAPWMKDGVLNGYIVAASPNGDAGDSLTDLALVFSIAGAAGLSVTVAGTVLVARREARPLHDLAEAARAASGSGFEQAIPPRNTGSQETRELRGALAELVDRQQEVMRRERAFFADSSHVLRTPLAVVQGNLERLEHGVDGEERRAVVAQARAALDSASRTLSGLLLLAREPDQEQPPWEVIELDGLLSSVAASARVTAPQLTITDDLASPLAVAGDPNQLRDLFVSVVENACRYTPAGGTVTISAHPDGDNNAIVEVLDTGIGISTADAAHATDRFFRGDAARRLFPGGSGLGLAIARRIVSIHHGDLAIAPGAAGGTSVRVILPLVS
jgi:signal transduction histidine kinase